MSLFRADDFELAQTISRLNYCNPFLTERVKLEREVLGSEFVGFEQLLHVQSSDNKQIEDNLERIVAKVHAALERAATKLRNGENGNPKERALYEDLALFWLYHRFLKEFRAFIERAGRTSKLVRVDFYSDFEELAERVLRIPGVTLPHDESLEQLFAFFFQLHRAFVNIYLCIVGGSLAAGQLRARIWQSIFTHDLHRYRRVLFDKMGDIATLIIGPSGSGKELVARAVGLSRFIPFDPRSRSFKEDFATTFHPLNLSAMSPTLIESELFGHKRGAFTGALGDRVGWFESCRPLGTVFLDEIGDLDPAIQVKLLRVLQVRTFQRLGESDLRHFNGKLIAATNRDLTRGMAEGWFRKDFYYRLCADVIETPSLRQITGGNLDELRPLVDYIAVRMIGEIEAETLTKETLSFIEREIGPDYEWPGNFRELEQCVRNILIRKEYQPAALGSMRRDDDLAAELEDGALTADELVTRYCRMVFERTKNLSETARRLGLDRRTVRARVKGMKVEVDDE